MRTAGRMALSARACAWAAAFSWTKAGFSCGLKAAARGKRRLCHQKKKPPRRAGREGRKVVALVRYLERSITPSVRPRNIRACPMKS